MTPKPMPTYEIDDRGLPKDYPLQEGSELAPRDIKTMLEAGEIKCLLDCRTPKEHATAGIEGAVLVPLQELPSRFGELEDHLDCCVVVFCHGGVRSMQALQFLRDRGFDNVKSMAGGIDLWSQTVDQAVPRY